MWHCKALSIRGSAEIAELTSRGHNETPAVGAALEHALRLRFRLLRRAPALPAVAVEAVAWAARLLYGLDDEEACREEAREDGNARHVAQRRDPPEQREEQARVGEPATITMRADARAGRARCERSVPRAAV